MPDLRVSSERAPIVAAAAVVVAALVWLRLDHLETFIAFALLVALSGLFEVTLPNEVAYPLGLSSGLGFALLGEHGLSETVVMFAAGAALSTAARAVARRPLRVEHAAGQTLAVAASASVYNWMSSQPGLPTFDAQETVISIPGFLAMLGTVLALHAILASVRVVAEKRIPFTPVFVGQIRSTAALNLSVMSVAALLALSYPALRYWSFPLFLAPLSATQFAFRQFESIRTTYLQTIRALSKVPEMAGYTRPGHSARVAELAVAIAREMSIDERELDEIEYAALLHDIGRVSLPEPDEGAHVTGRTELAIVGAEIVRETGHFPLVADMIARQYDPYRKAGQETARALPIGSRIIKVASAYDDMTRPDGVGLSHWDTVEHLHSGLKYEYDPAVVQALVRVVEKREAAERR